MYMGVIEMHSSYLSSDSKLQNNVVIQVDSLCCIRRRLMDDSQIDFLYSAYKLYFCISLHFLMQPRLFHLYHTHVESAGDLIV